MAGALDGVVVLDLSRVLAGPTCTQLLGDLGAQVLKIENPATGGDDTRSWGPPYVETLDGVSDLSAYFLSANRNKLSVCVDFRKPEGQAQIRRLAEGADIVVENYKPGGLRKYGLDHETFMRDCPHLIWCSISGFGQTGPNAAKPGYDIMAQGFGGIMSLTGEPDGQPMKVGVAVADVVCGLYAATGILAALHHRERTGEGQHIDLALADSQISWLVNVGVSHLTTGEVPRRQGNAHASIVPYQVFAAADGHVIVAVGNDGQFRRFCSWLGRPDISQDPAFATNPARLANREALMRILEPLLATRPMDQIITDLEAAQVPAGPVQTLDQVFASDQVAARGMAVEMPCEAVTQGFVRVIGNPLKFSRTPVSYRLAPPRLGQDGDL